MTPSGAPQPTESGYTNHLDEYWRIRQPDGSLSIRGQTTPPPDASHTAAEPGAPKPAPSSTSPAPQPSTTAPPSKTAPPSTTTPPATITPPSTVVPTPSATTPGLVTVVPAPGPSSDSKTVTVGEPSPELGPNLGTSLGTGQTLGTGQYLENGDYRLSLRDGNLVLTDKDGARLWESGTNNDHGKVISATFGANGALDLKADAYYQALTKWSTDAVPGGAELELTKEGKLVVLDANGKVIATIADPDQVKHLYLVSLPPPLGSPRMLKALLDSARLWLQDVVDHMGVGKTSAIPDFRKLLSNAGLTDTRNTGEMVDKYTTRIDSFDNVKRVLRGADGDVNVSAGNIADKTASTRSKIIDSIEDLKVVLRAPQLGKGAPAAVRADSGDFEYDSSGNLAEAELSRAAVEYIVGALFHCVDGVGKQYRQAVGEAERTRKQIDTNSPDYKAGLRDGLAQQRPTSPSTTGPSTNGPSTTGPSTTGPSTTGPSTTGPSITGPATTGPAKDRVMSAGTTDYSSLYKDLLGGGSNATRAVDGLGGPAADAKRNSAITKAINAAIERIEKSAYTPVAEHVSNAGGAGGGSAGAGAPNAGAGGAGVPSAGAGSGATPNSGAANGGGGGGGGVGSSLLIPLIAVSSMLPTLLETLKQRDSDSDHDDESDARERRPDEGDPNQPAPQPPGEPGSEPVTDPPPITPPATGSGAPPVGGKSMVDLPLEGTTQKVSSVVAQAVQRELNNPNGSDALAAYRGTPGEESAASEWIPVGDSQLRTGDVVRWADRSALVVLLDENRPRMIMNGRLIPLNSEGDFRGYFHPTGADMDAESPSRVPISTV